jgi:hypothetical protein
MHTPDNSFLLRLWRVPDEERQGWRVELENIQSGEKLGFSSLEDFFNYLKQAQAKEDIELSRVNRDGG